jgi:glutathione S-transferase
MNKLHVTLTSPYARVARAALIEHSLEQDIEVVVAKTRQHGSPYYEITSSGRVPFLERADGTSLEETDIICAYFDEVGKGSPLSRAMSLDEWAYGRLHGLARSYIDGVGVWGREVRRPLDEQSPTIIAHERSRNERLARLWEQEITQPLMTGDLNIAQLTLYCAMDALEAYTGIEATPSHPNLQAWRGKLSVRRSLSSTPPPPRK